MTLIPRQPDTGFSFAPGFGVASDSCEPYGSRWLFSFGAYGSTHVLVVGANPSLEDALETAAEWLEKYAPGVFSPPDYEDAAKDLSEAHVHAWFTPTEDRDDEKAAAAEEDHTYTESGWLLSWEWAVCEDPTREQLLALRGAL